MGRVIGALLSILVGIILAWGFALVYGAPAERQEVKLSGGDVIFLAEIGAVFYEDEDGVFVLAEGNKESRPEPNKDIDLRQNDIVMMMNGRRVKSLIGFQARYDSLEVGAAVKLGIRRGKELFISEFAKMDPDSLPQGKVMMVTSDGSGGMHASSSDGIAKKEISFSSKDGTFPLMGIGLVAQEGDNGPTVAGLIPGLEDIWEGETPAKGDVIVALNGRPIANTEDLDLAFSETKAGEKITVRFLRADEELTGVAKRVDPGSGMVIKKEKSH